MVMVSLVVVWVAESRLTSDEVSACSSNHEVSPWPLDFLKAREDRGRAPCGERHKQA